MSFKKKKKTSLRKIDPEGREVNKAEKMPTSGTLHSRRQTVYTQVHTSTQVRVHERNVSTGNAVQEKQAE